jgi:hypothetical protein
MVLSAGDLVEHPIFGTFRVLSVEAEEIVAERGEQTIRIHLECHTNACRTSYHGRNTT